MDASEKAGLEARSEGLGEQVQSMLATFEQQRHDFADVQAQVAKMTAEAWSSDKLVRVVSNTAGVPIEVHMVADAFRRSTPEKLGRSVAEAAQIAARLAAEQSRRAFAPITGAADKMPDLSDLVPGAPSIKDLFGSMLSKSENLSPPKPKRRVLDEEEEDEYYRNRSYLDERP
ncbi:YbaB/EbfC family nucleoid-associated protein [Nocardia sp. NBC_01499]|uniref:YbaB/EbfC family nucleoid-associated protein n=1 Tax=Nocardia sp. NBC_01499 TaxID=2903597 RepID=UPI0038700469